MPASSDRPSAVRQVPAAWASRRSSDHAWGEPALVRQRRIINRDAIQQFRQLAERARPLHRHRDRLMGPPAPHPELGVQRPILTRCEALESQCPSDQGLERHPPTGFEVRQGGKRDRGHQHLAHRRLGQEEGRRKRIRLLLHGVERPIGDLMQHQMAQLVRHTEGLCCKN